MAAGCKTPTRRTCTGFLTFPSAWILWSSLWGFVNVDPRVFKLFISGFSLEGSGVLVRFQRSYILTCKVSGLGCVLSLQSASKLNVMISKFRQGSLEHL